MEKGKESGNLFIRILLLHGKEFCMSAAKSWSSLKPTFNHSPLLHSGNAQGREFCGSDLD